MNSLRYKECEFKYIQDKLSTKDLILVVTATLTETVATHALIKPINGEDSILKVFVKSQTYYFGTFGKYNIAHVQCSMGSISKGSSIVTVSSAIELLKIRIIVMVGIAFGVDEDSQRIGDVLVSESIRPYDSKRVGEKSTVSRAIEVPASAILLSRFKSILLTWEYILPNKMKADLIFTRLLSGEELIDNIHYRNKLLESYPGSKGGEMEGTGLATACDSSAEWIVVKGICDFADGKKGQEKESRQRVAVDSALSACLEVFNSNHSFSDFGIAPYSASGKVDCQTVTREDVLFEVYDPSKEKFYIVRENDESFVQKLQQYGVWIFGPPGCGKSNLILRNLIQEGKDFIQINLSGCGSVKSFFEEILFELDEYFNRGELASKPKDIRGLINSIVSLLEKYSKGREIVLLIEEIPVGSEKNADDFIDKFYSLLVKKSLVLGLERVKVVLSSLEDPRVYLREHQQKIYSHIHFSEFKYWDLEMSYSLLHLIESETDFYLDSSMRSSLIDSSKGSPRFIKKFFKNYIAKGQLDSDQQLFLISEVDLELNYGKQ